MDNTGCVFYEDSKKVKNFIIGLTIFCYVYALILTILVLIKQFDKGSSLSSTKLNFYDYYFTFTLWACAILGHCSLFSKYLNYTIALYENYLIIKVKKRQSTLHTEDIIGYEIKKRTGLYHPVCLKTIKGIIVVHTKKKDEFLRALLPTCKNISDDNIPPA